jgi:hypothetical protein
LGVENFAEVFVFEAIVKRVMRMGQDRVTGEKAVQDRTGLLELRAAGLSSW